MSVARPYRSFSCRFRLLSVLVFLLAGCGSPEFPFDLGDDVGGDNGNMGDLVANDGAFQTDYEGDINGAVQSIVFKVPDPAERPLVSGNYRATFVYSDQAGLPATISVGFFKHPDIEPIVIQAAVPGEYSVDIDTTRIPDGNRSIQVTAVSRDGRQLSENGKILVDNNPPLIEIMEPTPTDNGGFVGNLALRVKVSDEGSLVRRVTITARQFSWSWPVQDGDSDWPDAPAAVVDTRVIDDLESETFRDMEIDTGEWRGGPLVLRVTASDGVAGRDAVVEHALFFVERPGLDGGEPVVMPLEDNKTVKGIQGIRLGPADDEYWGLLAMVNGPTGSSLGIYQRSARGTATLVDSIFSESCELFRIHDMDRDGYDDILGWCGIGESRRILVLAQSGDGSFVETWSLPTEYVVKDVAAGDLNRDGFPDIAFVSDVQPLWTGIVLSRVNQSGDFEGYGEPSFYSGAVKPNHVAIGRFSDDRNNAVVVGASGSGIITAYPIDEFGVPSMGENSSLDPVNNLIDDVSAMAAVNFSDMDGDNDALVVADGRGVEVVGVARLRQDASRRVEAVAQWATGVASSDIETGDLDGDGSPDIALLCAGSSMVQVLMGSRTGGYSDPVRDVVQVVSGTATDVTLADMDFDGLLDIVLLTGRKDLKVIYFRTFSGAGFLQGSGQAIVPAMPFSLGVGHFVQPLPGNAASFLDAATLYRDLDGCVQLMVFSSDSVTGQPTRHAGTINLCDNSVAGFVVGNFNIDLDHGSSDPAKRPDDLILTTVDVGDSSGKASSKVVLFEETGHRSVAASMVDLDAGKTPLYAATGEFNPGVGEYSAMDVAFLVESPNPDEKDWKVQAMIGFMDGTFSKSSPTAGTLSPVSAGWLNRPAVLKAVQLRRTLKKFIASTNVAPDLLVLGRKTGDIAAFLNIGFGIFQPKALGSPDLAVAGPPVDVTAGYLSVRVDEVGKGVDADDVYPDLVTLLPGHVLISYSLGRQAIRNMGEEVAYQAPVAILHGARAPVAVAVADMNVDGIQDIVVLDDEKSSVIVIPNLGGRRFAPPYVYPSGYRPGSMSIADFNGDGCPDVVTCDNRGRTVSAIQNRTKPCVRTEMP